MTKEARSSNDEARNRKVTPFGIRPWCFVILSSFVIGPSSFRLAPPFPFPLPPFTVTSAQDPPLTGELPMSSLIGQPLDALDTPQLLLDLDVVDRNVRRVFEACHARGVAVRVHFKSLKCTGLARYLAAAGADGFLCAKLNE